MRKIGDRVGAILKADRKTVHLFGYGTYDGEYAPSSEWLYHPAVLSAKITLDDGRVIWGHQCWWGDEEEIKMIIGGRKVVAAMVIEE